ncbi:hypothetical protein EDD15DRAFT_1014299 [Pisolithus albus]|nr:hypothetical protein EDD15DRAFT_1014299 [Pisolithus albus]
MSSASGSSVGEATAVSTSGTSVVVHSSSRSVSGSLHQKNTQPVVVKEIGPSRATPSVLAKECKKKPWVDVRTMEAADSRPCGATSAVDSTKSVLFTFRADAWARRVVTDPCISGLGANDSGGGGGSSGAGEKDKGNNRGDGGLKKLMLLESDHGEAWLRRQEECVPSLASSFGTSMGAVSVVTAATISTAVPRPFTFTTALRATERAKFDTLIHQKQEEMVQVREEARKQAEEEMARVVRGIR